MFSNLIQATPKQNEEISIALSGETGIFTQVYLEVNPDGEEGVKLSWFMDDFQYEMNWTDDTLPHFNRIAKRMTDEDFVDFAVMTMAVCVEALG